MFKHFRMESHETLEQFDDRVNTEVETLRAAHLFVAVQPLPGGEPTIWCSIGTASGGQFTDLSRAEVKQRLEARQAAAARGGPRILGG